MDWGTVLIECIHPGDAGIEARNTEEASKECWNVDLKYDLELFNVFFCI